jgi:hypothetical protein
MMGDQAMVWEAKQRDGWLIGTMADYGEGVVAGWLVVVEGWLN